MGNKQSQHTFETPRSHDVVANPLSETTVETVEVRGAFCRAAAAAV